MKKILLGLIIGTLAFGLAAQSRPFEVTKNSYDPFIAQKGGFESLFVNPAAMAGETDIFTFDIEAGTQGKRSTYEAIKLMMTNSAALMPSQNPDAQPMTAEQAEQVVELLVDNLDQSSIDLLTAGTILDGYTPEQIQTFFQEGNTLPQADIEQVATNVETHQDIILEDALADLDVSIEFTTKLGTLIKGFGLGIYANAYSILDAGQMGFQELIAETGIKAGYGFNVGPFGIGVSGDFAMVGDFTYDGGISLQNIAGIMNDTMYYGYAWGIDAGMTFQILPSLTVGAVMTDLIGTYTYAGTTTLDNMLSGGAPVALSSNYSFDLDLDFGITWAPQIGNGKLLNASFSADYYDFIELFRTPPQNFQDVLNHMRFGAHIELLSFINARAQYYREYFTVGAGVDLLFLEVFGEFQFNQTFTDIGAAALVKLHF